MSIDRTEVPVMESVKYLNMHITPDMVERNAYFIRDDDGVNNAVYEIDGEKYRVRVETFVKKRMGEETYIFYQENEKMNHYGTMYKIPGGSIEEDRTLAEQAEAECNEEILAKVKNVQYTGICYVNKYDINTVPQWHKDILWPIGLKYVGAITFVFTADYDGVYRKHVHDTDKDTLVNEGGWHSVKDFYKLRAVCHDDVVLESMMGVMEGLFDSFKTKYSDEELLKANADFISMNKEDGVAYWNTHGRKIDEKLYNMSPEPTDDEIRRNIIHKANSTLRNSIKVIKDKEFHKAIKFKTPNKDEMRDWIENGTDLCFAYWNIWRFNKESRTNVNSNIYFWGLMSGFLNDTNIHLGNRSFRFTYDGDWDDGVICLTDRNVTTMESTSVMEGSSKEATKIIPLDARFPGNMNDSNTGVKSIGESTEVVTESIGDMNNHDWMLHEATRMLYRAADELNLSDMVKVGNSYNKEWSEHRVDKVEFGLIQGFTKVEHEALEKRLSDMFSKRYEKLYRGYYVMAIPKGELTYFYIADPTTKIPEDVKRAYRVFETARRNTPEGDRFYISINDDYTISRARRYRDGRHGEAPLQEAYRQALVIANSYKEFEFSYDGSYINFKPLNTETVSEAYNGIDIQYGTNPVMEFRSIDNSYEIDLTEETVNKYKSQYRGLSHVRTGNDYNGKLILVRDGESSHVVGFVNVRKSDGMIQALEMNDKYRGKGGGKELLKISVSLGANQLTVNVNNDVAHDMYLKNGWDDTKIVGKMQYMVRRDSHLAMELAAIDSLGLNETHRLEALLETVQHSDAVYEFYRQYNTPWQLMNGLRKVGARWPNKAISGKIRKKYGGAWPTVWPEQIVTNKYPAVCADYALLEHYWAEYHHLENYILHIFGMVEGAGPNCVVGHAVGVVKFQDKWYIMDYHARKADKAKAKLSKLKMRVMGPEIIGPYNTANAIAEAYKDDFLGLLQNMIFKKADNANIKLEYKLLGNEEIEKLYDNDYGNTSHSQATMQFTRLGYYYRGMYDFIFKERGAEFANKFFYLTDFIYSTYDSVTGTFESTEDFEPIGEIEIAKEDIVLCNLLDSGRYGDKLYSVRDEIVKEASEIVPIMEPVDEADTSIKHPDNVAVGGIVDCVLNNLERDGRIDIKGFASTKSGKRFMYTRCKVMKKDIPLIIFLSYCEGLTTVMRKAGIRFEFSDTRPKLTGYDAVNRGVIQFADGYIVFNKYPLENSLLMNGLAVMDTKSVEYADMDTKDVYVNLFDVLYGARMLANALDNFYEWMIDPVTYTILQDLNYPTDFVGLLLAGNKLMADNNYVDEISMKNWRIRKNEMVYAEAYKRISQAYIRYRMTSNNRNPIKVSIPRDQIIKSIMQSQVVEDVSELSPVIEVKKANTITDQGPSGTNLKEAYTMKRRCYHDTMLGVMAISTSPDANVGIKKDLTVEPNVINARGYVKEKEDRDMEEPNLFSMVELLTPGSATQDDQVRLAMESKQSSHITPVKGASPVLMSNGAEKVLPYNISSDFVVVAKDDGQVEVFDEKTGVCVVKYKDGRTQLINMNSKIVKNGAGGFYLTNKLITNNLRKGTKFKKNDILAYNDRFFSESDAEGTRFNVGVLTKVACMSTYINFEDGDFVTDNLSKKLGTDVCMEISAIIGMNANVTYMVKKGDHVSINDPLIIYDASSKDANFNKMLDNIGKELKEEITGMGRTPIKAKYSGVIEDIKVYSTVGSKELSPSLRKIVEGYWAEIKAQESKYSKYQGNNMIETFAFMEKAGPIDGGEDGKVMGVKVGEGVYIRFFIKYQDNLDVGDKLVH